MIDLKISAVVGIAGSTIGAMIQAAQGNATGASILAAIGFGGVAAFATTFMVLGSYRTRVDRHEELIKALNDDKVSAKEMEHITERIDEMHETLNTIVRPIIERHFNERRPS